MHEQHLDFWANHTIINAGRTLQTDLDFCAKIVQHLMQGRTLDFCAVRTLKLYANLMLSVQQLMQAVQTQNSSISVLEN